MKLLFFADLHARKMYRNLRPEGVLSDILATIQEIGEIGSQYNVRAIISLGDIFHKSGTLSVELLSRVYDEFSETIAYGGELRFIVGNHDRSGKYTSLDTFSGITKYSDGIITEPLMITYDNVRFFCWPYTKGDYIWEEAEVFLGHLSLAEGILDGTDIKLKDEMSIGDVEDFYQLGLCGHYHRQQKVGDHFFYIGSSLQLSFREAYHKKYCVILDTEDLSLEWVELTRARQYKIVDLTSETHPLDMNDLGNSIVKFRIDDSVQIQPILVAMGENFPESEYVIEKVSVPVERKARVDPTLDTDDLIDEYIRLTETPLDKDELAKVGKLIAGRD